MLVFVVAFLLIGYSHDPDKFVERVGLDNLPTISAPEHITKLLNFTKDEVKIGPTIIEAKICDNQPDEIGDCSMEVRRNHRDIWVYWEVLQGVGCCATYSCNYDRFYSACLKDGFGIYDIYLDGRPKYLSVSDFDYTCEERVPWNYQMFENLETGRHKVTIEQKECSGQIVDKVELEFELEEVEGELMLFRI